MRALALVPLLLAACEGQTPGFGTPLDGGGPRFDVSCVEDTTERPAFESWWSQANADCGPVVCPPCDLPVLEAACEQGTCVARAADEGPAGVPAAD